MVIGGWTAYNSPGGTFLTGVGAAWVSTPSSDYGDTNWHGYTKPWTGQLDVKIWGYAFGNVNVQRAQWAVGVVRAGRAVFMEPYVNVPGGASWGLRWTLPGTFSAYTDGTGVDFNANVYSDDYLDATTPWYVNGIRYRSGILSFFGGQGFPETDDYPVTFSGTPEPVATWLGGDPTEWGVFVRRANVNASNDVIEIFGFDETATITSTASVADIAGTNGAPATFLSTGSVGNEPLAYRWAWTSVPGGSAIANAAVAFPDSGGTTYISMANNSVLFHCEEAAGATGFDTSGNGNNATLNTITVAAAGQVGARAWSYTAGGSEAVLATAVDISVNYSTSFWFFGLRPDGTSRSGMTNNAGSQVGPRVLSSNFLGIYNGSDRSSGFSMPAASYTGWNHLVMVVNGASTQFYVNGVYVGQCFLQRNNSDIRRIGNNAAFGERFADRLDEIAIWQRALSPKEIYDIYTMQKALYYSSSQNLTFTPDATGAFNVSLTAYSPASNLAGADTATATIT